MSTARKALAFLEILLKSKELHLAARLAGLSPPDPDDFLSQDAESRERAAAWWQWLGGHLDEIESELMNAPHEVQMRIELEPEAAKR